MLTASLDPPDSQLVYKLCSFVLVLAAPTVSQSLLGLCFSCVTVVPATVYYFGGQLFLPAHFVWAVPTAHLVCLAAQLAGRLAASELAGAQLSPCLRLAADPIPATASPACLPAPAAAAAPAAPPAGAPSAPSAPKQTRKNKLDAKIDRECVVCMEVRLCVPFLALCTLRLCWLPLVSPCFICCHSCGLVVVVGGGVDCGVEGLVVVMAWLCCTLRVL